MNYPQTEGTLQFRQSREGFVLTAIDGMVVSTGMPVAGIVLTESDMISKNGLKKLVRKGLLKLVKVDVGEGHVNAYYTDNAVPAILHEKGEQTDATGREQPEHHQQPGGTSEGTEKHDDQTTDDEDEGKICGEWYRQYDKEDDEDNEDPSQGGS
jgi:hypothetical protein